MIVISAEEPINRKRSLPSRTTYNTPFYILQHISGYYNGTNKKYNASITII
jgi:hypothetical protein